jgi:hypothetical protein
MAKEQRKIKVISYVYVGDQLTPVSELNEEQKERLAVGLQWGLLNSRYRNVATIEPPPGFECGHNEKGNITVQRVPATA